MANITNICIGIQARSTSERFPRKVFETIGGKPMLRHVIDACRKSAEYMNRHKHKEQMVVNYAVLIPFKDPILDEFGDRAVIVEGPEHDVLARYKLMSDRFHADYIVRITGDCPLIPSFLITKHIKTAVMNGYDYLSNVDESLRTSPDGHDCEVISKRLMDHLADTVTDPKDREHVTTSIRREPPEWAKVGHIVGFLDLSNKKISVDTLEDLERVRAEFESVKLSFERAVKKHGRQNVHRL